MIRKILNDSGTRLSLAMLFAIIQFAWAYQYYSYKINTTGLAVPANASADFLGNLIQAVVVSVPMLAAMFLAWIMTKESFFKKLHLGIPDGRIKKIIVILAVIYLAELIIALFIKSDRFSVLYQWFYYMTAIGFLEEFIWRGLIPELVHGKLPDEWVWLTPSMLFALMHGVLPLVNGTLKLIPFLRTDFIYFTAIGLLMEWLKRKTGTLWVPVLVHAVFDFIFVL